MPARLARLNHCKLAAMREGRRRPSLKTMTDTTAIETAAAMREGRRRPSLQIDERLTKLEASEPQ